jgi:hypothetical protein
MSLSGFDRKRADRFAEFTDTATGPRTHRRTSVDDELAPLAQLTHQLRDLRPVTTPRDEFRSALRSFLVATAERDGVGATATAAAARRDSLAADTAAWQAIKPHSALAGKTQVVRQVSGRTTGRTRLAILIGVAAGAIVLSGVSAASTGALPGDPLYSVKRSTERAQLALAGSDASRGRLYLEFARSRLAEARQVNSQAGTVLADMDDETRQGAALLLSSALTNHDSSAVTAVTAFVTQQLQALDDLGSSLSDTSVIGPSISNLDKIRTRADAIANFLAGRPGCVLTSRTDYLGPVPDNHC